MDTLYIKPAEGCLLRDPATGESIPPEGASVTLGPQRIYWMRRIKDGDAIKCEPPAKRRNTPAEKKE